ncbi:MAG: hypothetical protein RIQ52_86 [Pseudomonadota bacterium]|jgi:hypothetical protein
MLIKTPFDTPAPLTGEASIDIRADQKDIFAFVADRFFENYTRWAPEVVEFEPIDGDVVRQGARARQLRVERGCPEESILCVTTYRPNEEFVVEGEEAPFSQCYMVERSDEDQALSTLTFRFELRQLELFMRPFQKLIRIAIEEGAEKTVENIGRLLNESPTLQTRG